LEILEKNAFICLLVALFVLQGGLHRSKPTGGVARFLTRYRLTAGKL